MSRAQRPVAIITGANTGIGFQTALALAKKGYAVVLAVRNLKAGGDAAASINAASSSGGGSAEVMLFDATSLKSVRDFSSEFISRYNVLHALVCNAGISGAGLPKELKTTGDGYAAVMQSNYLAHFMLINSLLPLMKSTASSSPTAPSRIVLLSSVTHRLVRPPKDWAPVIGQSRANSSSYGMSKLACLMLAYNLQRTLAGTNIVAVAVNPGAVASDIWRHNSSATECWMGPIRRLFFLNSAQGAATSIAAASAGEVQGRMLTGGKPWYLTPYSIPAAFHMWEWPSLLFDSMGPGTTAKLARSTAASLDPASAKALVAASEAAIAGALERMGS
jgi:NAD(P)-dependent dehydrogenase (short-subunit alcohol dehydrogenase family)